MRPAISALTALILVATARGQEPAQFDVVSIKANDSGAAQMVVGPRNGRFRASNVTPQFLVEWAFELRGFRIVNMPSWATQQHFDIATNGPADLTEATARPLVQALLADRFQMRMHMEARTQGVYVLMPTRPGAVSDAPNVRSTRNSCQPGRLRNLAPPPRAMYGSDATVSCGLRLALGHISGMAITMAEVTEAISREVNRTVIDKSEIRDNVDLVLNFLPGAVQQLIQPDAVDQPGGGLFPGLFTAVQEQLGLRLVADEGPVQVLVVDRLSPPTPN
jgi:uncharacterized protein (TIGR03435 family)